MEKYYVIVVSDLIVNESLNLLKLGDIIDNFRPKKKSIILLLYFYHLGKIERRNSLLIVQENKKILAKNHIINAEIFIREKLPRTKTRFQILYGRREILIEEILTDVQGKLIH